MTNSYIKSVLEKGTFNVSSSFRLFGEMKTCEFKIDTGCSKTCVPIKRLGVDNNMALELKQQALRNGVRYVRSYGISDTSETREKDSWLIKNDKAIDCKALKFYHLVEDWELSQFHIGNAIIGINYDRTSNILLGMDILKDWDIHIGKSAVTGVITFLGCPKNEINPGYIQALEEEFLLYTKKAC
ncbi:MAG: hypothetical protein HFI28_01875 [Lachnospiraceae bacterium]|nr:hypothetical protein [Lachnospiraceae bacterium]